MEFPIFLIISKCYYFFFNTLIYHKALLRVNQQESGGQVFDSYLSQKGLSLLCQEINDLSP